MSSLYALFQPTSSPAKTNPKPPSETQLVSLLHGTKTTLQLRQLHARALLLGLASTSLLATQLISTASLRGSPSCYPLSVFRHSAPRNLFTFNALIRALVKASSFRDALDHFVLMLSSGVRPDRLTCPFVLKSVAGLRLGWAGQGVHGIVVRLGLGSDSFVKVSLVDMYVKVGDLGLAWKVFEESPERFESGSTLLWNVLIGGFCKGGDVDKAVELFLVMPEKSVRSWNCLIEGFMWGGNLKQAKKLFQEMPEKDVVSWSMMVNGYLQNGKPEKALSIFFRMLDDGVRPNSYTVVSALSACAKIGALDTGTRIHNYLKENSLKRNQIVENALVDMYAKCGSIEAANDVFKDMEEKDALTWTAMIWGWAIHGDAGQAIKCFKRMMHAGIKPDEVIFLGLLNACAHDQLVDLGINFFESMRLDYSIEPTMKHYTLVVDMLGKIGRVKEALDFIQEMPITPDFMVWGVLLCAAKVQNNYEIAELASQKLLEFSPDYSENYAFMSNVDAAVGQWADQAGVRISMQSSSVKKDPGWSHIEVEGVVHSFVSGNCSHRDAKDIKVKLDEVMEDARKEGYAPGTEWVRHHMEEEKEETLRRHSEKVALAFGLVRTPPGATIRIVQNKRVCRDCHSFFKHASKIGRKEIMLKDTKRFHHFKDGACSCRDIW